LKIVSIRGPVVNDVLLELHSR